MIYFLLSEHIFYDRRYVFFPYFYAFTHLLFGKWPNFYFLLQIAPNGFPPILTVIVSFCAT